MEEGESARRGGDEGTMCWWSLREANRAVRQGGELLLLPWRKGSPSPWRRGRGHVLLVAEGGRSRWPAERRTTGTGRDNDRAIGRIPSDSKREEDNAAAQRIEGVQGAGHEMERH